MDGHEYDRQESIDNSKLMTHNMKRTTIITVAACAAACTGNWTDNAIETASWQLQAAAERFADTDTIPRSTYTWNSLEFIESQVEMKQSEFYDVFEPQPSEGKLGKVLPCSSIYDWTSGFFPGSLWYAYEISGKESLKEMATAFTKRLEPVRKLKDTHDIGFMMQCSYGNALRLAPADSVKAILIETADNLIARFDPRIGCIRSWDFGEWNYPVIIDNMMNLDLLFNVSRLTGDSRYRDVAVQHAMTTMKNHFRPDYTTWHVVSYNDDGSVEMKVTHQGKNHDSSWSRGQGWAIYGYSMCYRETGDSIFLDHAVKVADMIMKHNTAPKLIPYWDFEAPAKPETPRDASAAAIIASAMLELSTYAPDGQKYFG